MRIQHVRRRRCGGPRLQDLADLLLDAGTVAAVRLVAHGKAWVQLGSPEQAQRALEHLGRVGPSLWLLHFLPACVAARPLQTDLAPPADLPLLCCAEAQQNGHSHLHVKDRHPHQRPGTAARFW